MQSSLAKRIPGARQVVIPNAGHALTIDEPEQFNGILTNFLLN
jgi:pimeloyl-ACP methyl ester carboxylesterase